MEAEEVPSARGPSNNETSRLISSRASPKSKDDGIFGRKEAIETVRNASSRNLALAHVISPSNIQTCIQARRIVTPQSSPKNG